MDVHHETTVEKTFNFTTKDLSENRQGRLSAPQAERLRRGAARTALIIVGVMGAVAVLAIASSRPSPGDIPMFLLCLIPSALIALALTVGITETALAPRVVSKRTGQIHLAAAPSDYRPPIEPTRLEKVSRRRRWWPGFGNLLAPVGHYSMIVEDQQFNLTRDEYEALIPAVYNVYFLPTLDKIVSVELVSISVDAVPEPPPSIPPKFEDDSQDTLRA
jgi:hypothetical protein